MVSLMMSYSHSNIPIKDKDTFNYDISINNKDSKHNPSDGPFIKVNNSYLPCKSTFSFPFKLDCSRLC